MILLFVLQVTPFIRNLPSTASLLCATMSLEFANKVVIVTGSSGGLGSFTAKEFAKQGASVVITGRRQDAVQKTVQECNALSPNGSKAFPFVADVTKVADLKCLVDAVVGNYGKIDVLVNSAGGGAFSSIYDPKLLETLDHMIQLDIKSVVALTQLVVPHLEKTNGAVVNISSILGQQPVSACPSSFCTHSHRCCRMCTSCPTVWPKLPWTCSASASLSSLAPKAFVSTMSGTHDNRCGH